MPANIESRSLYVKDLHFDHKLWLNELKFNKEEVAIFEHRLEELVVRYTDMEVLAKLEQFQNHFIREKEVIDELIHKIKEKENDIAEYAEDHQVAADHHHIEDHKALRNEVSRFRELFGGLKNDFFKYLAKYM